MKDQIKELAQTLTPFRSVDSLNVFITKWFIYSVLIVLVAYRILPLREDFLVRGYEWSFITENILWLAISGLGSLLFYQSTFPEEKSTKFIKVPAYLSLALVFLVAFARFDFQNPLQEIHKEMDLWRGGCGLFIFMIAFLQSLFMMFWARKSAPSSPYSTGFWAAISCSAMGCLIMQFVCDRDTTSHLLIWHFVPMAFISFGGGIVARKALRW